MTPHDDHTTPEEAYDEARRRYGDGTPYQQSATMTMIEALRAMIASINGELNTMTSIDGQQVLALATVSNRVSALAERMDLSIDEQDAVVVPRSLMDALDIAIERATGTNGYTLAGSTAWKQLAERYDAWKAGQG